MFIFPLAFLALLAVPALIAIYWLHNRFRRYPVSGLMLWRDQRQIREGGLLLRRMQVPLLFFLELFTILLLVTAAAEPRIPTRTGIRPLVVVLDDSFSMLAGEGETSRSRAVAAIEEELRRGRHNPVHFVLAGETPQVLGEPAPTDQAIALLQDWKCLSPSSNLEEAIAFAFELGGTRARILVVTDHAPPQEMGQFVGATGRSPLQWWAFGSPRANVAFVNAGCTLRDGQEHCLLEIANLSPHTATTTLSVKTGLPRRTADQGPWTYELGSYETRKIFLNLEREIDPTGLFLPTDAPAVQAHLSEDVLGIDNQVILLPQTKEPIQVEVRIRDAALRALIEKAIQATREAKLIATFLEDDSYIGSPLLLFTDWEETRIVGSETWVMQIIAPKDAEAYLGPFVVDRMHPLTEGLSLGGVVWSGGKTEQIIGTPIITAGNIPLLTDVERFTGRHELRMQLRLDLSTLQNTPNWPILIWNLVHWRATWAPGLRQPNLRLGTEAILTVESGTKSVQVVDPNGKAREMPVRDKTITIKAADIGMYEIRTKRSRFAFASNALYREESDLTKCTSGRWGNWMDTISLQWEYKSIAWLFMLLAMVALTIHKALVVPRP